MLQHRADRSLMTWPVEAFQIACVRADGDRLGEREVDQRLDIGVFSWLAERAANKGCSAALLYSVEIGDIPL